MPLAQVCTHPRPQLIFPSKSGIFGVYLNFEWQKSLKSQYLPHSESNIFWVLEKNMTNVFSLHNNNAIEAVHEAVLVPLKFDEDYNILCKT